MYIEDRLFSENTEEVLFSVLMDEEEYDLYSDFQEYLFSDSNSELTAAGALTTGAGLGLGYMAKHTSDQTYKRAAKDIIKEDPEFMKRKLKELAGNDKEWLKSAEKAAESDPKSVETLLRSLGKKDYDKARGKMKPIADRMKKGFKKSRNYKRAAIGAGAAGLGMLGYGLNQ